MENYNVLVHFGNGAKFYESELTLSDATILLRNQETLAGHNGGIVVGKVWNDRMSISSKLAGKGAGVYCRLSRYGKQTDPHRVSCQHFERPSPFIIRV